MPITDTSISNSDTISDEEIVRHINFLKNLLIKRRGGVTVSRNLSDYFAADSENNAGSPSGEAFPTLAS